MRSGIHSFIMSGGIGSRLWPFSRADNPKQFHRLTGSYSMLRNTIRRFGDRDDLYGPVSVIASADHAAIVRQESVVEGIRAQNSFFEPVGRNTAAAVAIATQGVLREGDDDLILIVPSDHDIATAEQFHETIATGIDAARNGALIVFGIPPTRPETGYGYIKAGMEAARGVLAVDQFVEKPDIDTARAYVDAGHYFWNSGMILFRASVMADHFRKLAPEIWNGVAVALDASTTDDAGTFLPMEHYCDIPAHPVDTAILEQAAPIALVAATFRWSDIGSWQSLYEIAKKDTTGNAIVGDVVAENCENSYFHNEGPLVTAYGLKNMAVISTDDATFVAPLARSQDVKDVFQTLERGNRAEVRVSVGLSRAKEPGTNCHRVRRWLTELALPLWADIGPDTVHGGFHEAVAFDGRSLNLPKRLRTMARQTWCFAKAAEYGWMEGADRLVAHGMDHLCASASHRDHPFARTVSFDAKPVDTSIDTYDQAFVLLAAAAAHRAGDDRAHDLGQKVLAHMETSLHDAESGAWLNAVDGSATERRANPHMHLLEAFLAWQEATGSTRASAHADRLVDLFRNHFFDPDNWAVIEILDENFQPVAGKAGQRTEPGHHFEWAWLLGEHARQRGTSHPDEARKVYATGVSQGLSRKTNLGWASTTPDGVPIERFHRSWPQAEALKAAIILDRTGKQELAGEIEARVDRLFAWHLDTAPDGMWVDRIDEHGIATATQVPASIFYHMLGAMMAYLDHFGNTSG